MGRKSQPKRSFKPKVPIGNSSPTPNSTDKNVSAPAGQGPSNSNHFTRNFFNPPKGPRWPHSKIRTQPEQDSLNANQTFLNVGPAPQPLRFPGFAAQQAPQNRNTPLVTGRLQNTKLGEFAVYDQRFSDLAEFLKVTVQAGLLVAR